VREMIRALQVRARIGVRARHVPPRRKPHRLRLIHTLLSLVLSLLLSATLHITVKVYLAPCGNHPARAPVCTTRAQK